MLSKTNNDLAWGISLSIIGVFLLVLERDLIYSGILGLGIIFLVKNWLQNRHDRARIAPLPAVAKVSEKADNKIISFDERVGKH